MTTDAEKRYYRVERRDLVYLKFILEAYEGLSTLSTFDNKKGIVQLTVPLPFRDDMARLIGALQQEIDLTEVAPPDQSTQNGVDPCSTP